MLESFVSCCDKGMHSWWHMVPCVLMLRTVCCCFVRGQAMYRRHARPILTARDPRLQLAHNPADPSVPMSHQVPLRETWPLLHGIQFSGLQVEHQNMLQEQVQEPATVDDQPSASTAAGTNKTPLMLHPSHPEPSPQLPSEALKPSVPSQAVQAATTDQARQCLAVIELVSVHSAWRCSAQMAMYQACPVPLHVLTPHGAAQHR